MIMIERPPNTVAIFKICIKNSRYLVMGRRPGNKLSSIATSSNKF